MNWETIRTAIRDVMITCSGLSTAGAVEFGDEAKASYARLLPRIDLSIRSLKGYGADESRADGVDEYISGPRRFTLSVRIESDAGVSGQALQIANDIQTRLARNSVLATLKAASLAVSGSADAVLAGFKRDGRSLNIAVFDLFMNAAENDLDETSVGFIDRATVESEYLTHPDGAQSPQVVIDPIVSIAVTPTTATGAAFTTVQMTATATLTSRATQDVTASVAWSSSNDLAATINAAGLATFTLPGSANITAESDGVTSNTAVLTAT